MPPSLGYEKAIALVQGSFVHLSGHLLILPDSTVQQRSLWFFHHLRSADSTAALPPKLPLRLRKDQIPSPGREQAHSLLATQLIEQIRIGVAVYRRVCGLRSNPDAGGIDVAFADLQDDLGCWYILLQKLRQLRDCALCNVQLDRARALILN